METIPNVLAERYATPAMRAIWSPVGRIRLEREYWIAVLKAQRDLGIDVPAAAIVAYTAVIDHIDLADLAARERQTRHDVKARIEAFNAAAGCEHLHKGMTSRDLTENVEQLQVYRSLCLLADKGVAILNAFATRARLWRDLPITGRTHNVAAQPTTLGKRLAMFGEETLLGWRTLADLRQTYPARGLKGAVGTQLDQLTLLAGDPAKVDQLEQRILSHLDLPARLQAVGQVYPRSLDFAVVAAFCQFASGPANFARTLRLMAGLGWASEGFAPGQVGSSAMPHKMNARSCERINGLHAILKGHLTMAAALTGDQWNEGDVSCSVVRRVLLPDACFALDGLLETTLTVLAQMEVFPGLIDQENRQHLPFLASTTLLMEAVKAGAGREQAHAAIREHSLAVMQGIRAGTAHADDLAALLAADARLGLDRARIEAVLGDAAALCGRASEQVDAFVAASAALCAAHPDAAAYQPGAIL
jgi:adenylosuccinate lyase